MGRHRLLVRCMFCDKILKTKRAEAQLRIDAQIIVTICRPCKAVVQRYKNVTTWAGNERSRNND